MLNIFLVANGADKTYGAPVFTKYQPDNDAVSVLLDFKMGSDADPQKRPVRGEEFWMTSSELEQWSTIDQSLIYYTLIESASFETLVLIKGLCPRNLSC